MALSIRYNESIDVSFGHRGPDALTGAVSFDQRAVIAEFESLL